MTASTVATIAHVFAEPEARFAPAVSPDASNVLTLFELTMPIMPSRPSGQHFSVATMVDRIVYTMWFGMLLCAVFMEFQFPRVRASPRWPRPDGRS